MDVRVVLCLLVLGCEFLVTAHAKRSGGEKSCPTGWRLEGDSCYNIVSSNNRGDRVSWDDAEKRCQDAGGHLVSIHNDQQQTYIYNKIIETNEYWIGLRDYGIEDDDREWSDNTEVDQLYWNVNAKLPEPGKGNGEDCAFIQNNDRQNFQTDTLEAWGERNCNVRMHYICGKQPRPCQVLPCPSECSTGMTMMKKDENGCETCICDTGLEFQCDNWDDYSAADFGAMATKGNIGANWRKCRIVQGHCRTLCNWYVKYDINDDLEDNWQGLTWSGIQATGGKGCCSTIGDCSTLDGAGAWLKSQHKGICCGEPEEAPPPPPYFDSLKNQ